MKELKAVKLEKKNWEFKPFEKSVTMIHYITIPLANIIKN